mmetsp:Transcript_3483/g.8221  ORF Transcript_3483/g.8221 Transcript_3483/m.8221 type:complete len:234 (+) Transcript_3483:145-846(+)
MPVGGSAAMSPAVVTEKVALALRRTIRHPPPGAPTRVTLFDSSAVPNITIEEYVCRLATFCKASNECLYLALLYLDRFSARVGIMITPKNVHRLFFTSMLVSIKYWDDYYYTNEFYGGVGGIRLVEVNRLEQLFLRSVRYSLLFSPEEYAKYQQAVEALVPAEVAPAHRPVNFLHHDPVASQKMSGGYCVAATPSPGSTRAPDSTQCAMSMSESDDDSRDAEEGEDVEMTIAE